MTAMTHFTPTGVADPYAPGKLDPFVHYQLVRDLTRYTAEAGIGPRDVTGHDYHLTDQEVLYLKGFRRAADSGILGIIFIGQNTPSVHNRCRSMCGALMRNFISSRYVMRDELVTMLFDQRHGPRADFVAVPDFHYLEANAATKRALISWFMGRVGRGQQTAVGVPNHAAMVELLGPDHATLKKHFTLVHGQPMTN